MLGQYNIDEIIYNLFDKPGIFIEAGAADPFNQSNTAFLEHHGWWGLLIEPRYSACLQCQQHRRNSIVENYALVEKDYDKDTLIIGEDLIHNGLCTGSTPDHLNRNRNIQVPCCTLDKLLRKHNLTHVNFLSLDTEGWEHQIVDGIDFTYCKFDVILIETHDYSWSTYKHNTRNFDYIMDYGYVKYDNLISQAKAENYVALMHKDFKPKGI